MKPLDPLDIVIVGDTMINNIKQLEYICTNPNYNSILIFGQPGAGKEIIKDTIFYGSAFYPILENISLVNQEAKEINRFLFGYYDQFGRHQKGLIARMLKEGKGKAFLFIDEIDKVNNEVRGSLLRLLQNKSYYVPNSINEESAEGMRYIFAGSFSDSSLNWKEEDYKDKKPIEFINMIKKKAKEIDNEDLGPPDFWTRMDEAVLVRIPVEDEFYTALFSKEWDKCVKNHLDAHFGNPGPFMDHFKKQKDTIAEYLKIVECFVKRNYCVFRYNGNITIFFKITGKTKWENIQHNYSSESIREFINKIRGKVGECFRDLTK